MRQAHIGILVAVVSCTAAVGIAFALPSLLSGDPASRTEPIEIGNGGGRMQPSGASDRSPGKRAESRGRQGADREPGGAQGAAADGANGDSSGVNSFEGQPAGSAAPPPAPAPSTGGGGGGGGSGGGGGGGQPPPAPAPPAPAPAPTPDDDGDDDDGEIDDDDDEGDSIDGGDDD